MRGMGSRVLPVNTCASEPFCKENGLECAARSTQRRDGREKEKQRRPKQRAGATGNALGHIPASG